MPPQRLDEPAGEGVAEPLGERERPGLGIDINEAEAAKYPYKPAYMPVVRREDGSMFVY